MAKLIQLDGTTTEVSPANGTHFTIEEFYKLIDCRTFEVIRLPITPAEGLVMIGDEEGGFVEGNVNREATRIYREKWGIHNPHVDHDQMMQELRDSGENVIDASGDDDPYLIHGIILLCNESELR